MEGLVVIHPVWWFGPPAILKGWVDQVLVDRVAIRQQDEGSPKPLLKGRRALLVQTYNAARSVDRLVMRKMSEQFWRRAVFLSVGILRTRRLAFYGVDGISQERADALGAKAARTSRRWAE
jgi:NAD(P)H dehydrogenase (quinone)